MTAVGRAAWAVVVATVLGSAGVAPAHHVGAYTPRDNDVTTNFKQLKAAVQARKFDVALRLYDSGAVRREMRAQAAALPPGLDTATRRALESRAAPEVERNLMVFFLALARDLAHQAERQISDAALSVEARSAAGQRFLEAIWRYYNLVDFAVSQLDSRASVGLRLAFDEAEGYVKAATAPVGAASAGRRGTPADPGKLRAPLRQIAQLLSGVIDGASPSTRRDS
jgi:hypothetical protein